MKQERKRVRWAVWPLAVLLAVPYAGAAGGKPAAAAETGGVLAANSFDPDAFAGWGLWAGEGSTVTKQEADGVEGKAVKIVYDRSEAGWGLVAHADFPAGWNLTGTRTLQFYAKGDGTAQRFSIGVEEKDGGDKFRKLVAIEGDAWTLVTIPASELEYQDGGGDRVLDWDKVASLNISPEENRAGSLLLDDVTFGAYEPSLANGFDPDAFQGWGLWAGEGSAVTKTAAAGVSGQGLQVNYTRSGQGWGLVAHGFLPADWKPAGTEAIRFMIRGDGTPQRLSVGVEEKDGGDKFAKVIDVGSASWTPVTIRADELAPNGGSGDGRLDWDRVDGINLSPEDNRTGSFVLDDFTFYKGGLLPPVAAPARLALAELRAAVPGSVFASDAVTFRTKLTNGGDEAAAVPVAYVVKDDKGAAVASGRVDPASVPAGGSAEAEIAFAVGPYGYFTVEASVGGDDGGTASVRRAAFARVADPALEARKGGGSGGSKSGEALMGFSTHYDYLTSDALRAQEAELIRLSGAAVVRNDFLWDTIEPRKGVFDWTLYDGIVEANRSRGIRMIGLLAYSAKWASTGPEGAEMREHYPPRTLTEYANYVYETVSRYKGRIDRWEIWNEPNLDGFYRPAHDAEGYAELLKAGYLAAKRADPKATVVMSGLSGTGAAFLKELAAYGAGDYTDAIVIHPYQAGDPEAGHAFVNDIESVKGIVPGKDVWLTEWGWRSDEQGLANQALYTVKGYLLALAAGVKTNTLYSFNIATDTEFGLADANVGGEVKPIYPAVAALNRIVGGHAYAGRLGLGEGVEALGYEGRGGDEDVIALWTAGPAAEVALPSRKTLTRYDPYGNASTLPSSGGLVRV
ncbi:carbohydrate binding domain-containing protein [Cohnella nanjingensis]|uniref:Endo-1,4-beta-xylanase n=1 Tax=Cohnella nanjingensis TaxID=1387779 RepID=A0A7X0VHK2_9BACL|nr:carbohydrate binding domain-containing protein [Cohnella nanjingensis]MBB6673991.1 endo-1,4-beta-xylanase [Cohnella nanjingensis]